MLQRKVLYLFRLVGIKIENGKGGSEEVEGKKEKKKEEKRGESEMIDHFQTIDTRKCTMTRNSHEARIERRCICKHCEK